MSIQLRRRVLIPRRLIVLEAALPLAAVLALALIPWHPDESKILVSRHLLAQQNDWEFYDFRVHLDSFVASSLTANAMMLQGDRHNLPDFQRYCYYRGVQSVLRSGVIPTPQEGAE